MSEKEQKQFNMLLVLPAGLLLLEGIIVIVLLALGYEINQSLLFFLVLLAAFLIFQIGRQLSTRLRVQKAIGKVEDGKAMVDSGHPFKAIKLWKNILLSLPRDKYLEVLTLLEKTYEEQSINAALQQVNAIRSESYNLFEKTKIPKNATAKDRKEWRTKALEIKSMIKALPTEPNQDLSDALNGD